MIRPVLLSTFFVIWFALSACGGRDCAAEYQTCALDVIVGCEREGFSEECTVNSLPVCDAELALCAGENGCAPVLDACSAECTSDREACRQECDYRYSRCLRASI